MTNDQDLGQGKHVSKIGDCLYRSCQTMEGRGSEVGDNNLHIKADCSFLGVRGGVKKKIITLGFQAKLI